MTQVTRYAPHLPNWPDGLPLRIAVLSDFHASDPWTTAKSIRAICVEANGLVPDVILLLGDYASGPRFSRKLLPAHWAEALATLRAPLGVHAVLGNHDYDHFTRAEVASGPVEIERALLDAGIPVYVNRSVRLKTGRGGFWLAGLGSQMVFRRRRGDPDRTKLGVDELEQTLAQVTTDEPIVLMAHEPDIFPQVPDRVALTLSGHTHGGQVRVFGKTPVVPSRFGSRYVYGHIVEHDRHLIVTSGLGYSGWPIRFGTTEEIVLIELGQTA